MKRLATGVPGLDAILGGGIEPGGVAVLTGPPGTGKTVLAQQICFATATERHHAVYYTTLSEPHSKIVRHLDHFSFFDQDALGPKVEYLHLGDLIREEEREGLSAVVAEIVRKVLDERPVLVVIDSARVLRDFTDAGQLRTAFYDLTSRLAHSQTALLLVGEYTPAEMRGGPEFVLADSIIQLMYEPREPIDRRWMRIIKMRGARHLEGKHTFRIDAAGFTFYPRIETLDTGAPATVTGRIGAGVDGLGELMGGGIGAGEATVVLGPSGVGKTILGLRFVVEGLDRGERCLYVTFQDTAEQLIKMASGFGWDLQTPVDKGQLVIHHVPLGDLDLDMLAAGVRRELEGRRTGRVVIDSLAEMVHAARELERFPAYARALTGLIRASGASLLITSETTTLGPSAEPVGGVMFLFHNVILLRYIELASSTGRALSIVKMRNSDHSKDVHQFQITAEGFALGERLDQVTGTLGWSALRGQDGAAAL
ncbi:ATPase domain-containing protein [Pilimelia columellifera]|uniref:non-specific serine/threonine protein kinase n=1 Tax=Pilimelia columellifera subsp. columellifera TaxID=706583 RepID=A0ABP6ADU2_9ACTN